MNTTRNIVSKFGLTIIILMAVVSFLTAGLVPAVILTGLFLLIAYYRVLILGALILIAIKVFRL